MIHRLSRIISLAILWTFLQIGQVATKTSTTSSQSCDNAVAAAVRNVQFRDYLAVNSPYEPAVRIFSAWSGGGGDKAMIPQDSGHPFAGRWVGNGDRRTIYGSRLYGSGYPSSYSNGSDAVQGRGFPYGTWPISWGAYRGGEEYTSSTLDVLRPGGPLVTVNVTSNPSNWPNIPTTEVYQLVGDRDSVMFMMSDLADWCHAKPQWPQAFSPSAPGNATTQPKPENVIQYYRASSFALTFAGYNNTAALGSASSTASVPLPGAIVNSPFLACINDTIAVALPILDWPRDNGLEAGVIAGIVIGSIFGAVLLLFLVVCIYTKCR